MKRNLLICALVMVLILLLVGCGCEHEWLATTCASPKTCQLCGETEGETLPHTLQDATCAAPKTCTVCNATEGEALPHTFQDATCTAPKICTVCNATEGDPLPHSWQNATCTAPKTCTVCKTTEGNALGHSWKDATCAAPKTCSVCKITEGKTAEHKWDEATTEAPKTCSVCNKTEGSKLKTDSRFTTKSTKILQGTWICDVDLSDEMVGFEDFGSVDYRMIMNFGNTGTLSMEIKLKDEEDYIKKLKDYTIEIMYESFAQEGLTKEQADQKMLDEYGLNVEDYVEASLKNYNVNDMLGAFSTEEVYYVEGNTLYTAMSWNAKFESTEFKINNGELVINEITLEEGGSPLVFKRP